MKCIVHLEACVFFGCSCFMPAAAVFIPLGILSFGNRTVEQYSHIYLNVYSCGGFHFIKSQSDITHQWMAAGDFGFVLRAA